jgi:hypothetical protein
MWRQSASRRTMRLESGGNIGADREIEFFLQEDWARGPQLLDLDGGLRKYS